MAGAWQMAIEWDGPAGQGSGELPGRRAMNTRIAFERPHCDADDRRVQLGSITGRPGAACRPASWILRTGCRSSRLLRARIEQEPSLRAARSQIDVAQGMRLQASLRPNPSVSFERREEPGGTDNLTTVGVEWPLDLFRRSERIAVADREVATAQLAVADRERLLRGRGPHAVRRRPCGRSGSRRSWTSSWPRHDGNTTCFGLVSMKEPRRRSSAICWMSNFDACRPSACFRQAGPRRPCSS